MHSTPAQTTVYSDRQRTHSKQIISSQPAGTKYIKKPVNNFTNPNSSIKTPKQTNLQTTSSSRNMGCGASSSAKKQASTAVPPISAPPRSTSSRENERASISPRTPASSTPHSSSPRTPRTPTSRTSSFQSSTPRSTVSATTLSSTSPSKGSPSVLSSQKEKAVTPNWSNEKHSTFNAANKRSPESSKSSIKSTSNSVKEKPPSAISSTGKTSPVSSLFERLSRPKQSPKPAVKPLSKSVSIQSGKEEEQKKKRIHLIRADLRITLELRHILLWLLDEDQAFDHPEIHEIYEDELPSICGMT